ncbi:MAG: prepilin-type N-terminal cleavage/methylation domain-containing protein [Verrucomicrobiales bacterium]|nr:prepilin-type N-terminal cleavage/methylation domain-containing protein [Verrucomicrobiales bacterium]
MRNRRKPKRTGEAGKSGGFTLMELLVVVTIIAILAGFLFPVVNGIIRKTRGSQAEQTAQNLKAAISAYFTDYRKYPARSDGGTIADVTVESSHELMDILLPSDAEKRPGGLNTRGTGYYTGKTAKPISGGRYRSGVVLEADGGGELWDPFGSYYRVRMDADYNQRVDAPTWYTGLRLAERVIVWSPGPDRDDDDSGDNIKTW